MRILVHAGFYKTGTSSLQAFLRHNRAALAPAFDYHGPGDFNAAGAAARIYAQRPFPWRLWQFRRALRATFRAMPAPASGLIVLSRENFSGAMPGHRDWRGRTITGFPAAVPLCRALTGELCHRFGADAQIEFLFTTRDRAAWLASVHGHLLRSIDLTDDLETFAARFSDQAPLAQEAARIARALAPTPVHTAALEDLTQSREGPAAALLDLTGIAPAIRATLKPVPPANTGQPADLRAAFLALNRQGLPRHQLRTAKQALLDNVNSPASG